MQRTGEAIRQDIPPKVCIITCKTHEFSSRPREYKTYLDAARHGS